MQHHAPTLYKQVSQTGPTGNLKMYSHMYMYMYMCVDVYIHTHMPVGSVGRDVAHIMTDDIFYMGSLTK